MKKIWQRHPDFNNVITEAWTSTEASSIHEVNQKMRVCCDMISSWNHSEFGHVQPSVRTKKLKLAYLLYIYVLTLITVTKLLLVEIPLLS